MCVSLFQYYDDPMRRRYYGRAGEYRTPDYGFEYRVLSNAWLQDFTVYNLIYEMARRVIGAVVYDNRLFRWDADPDETRECINNCDVELAHKILKRNDKVFSALIHSLPLPKEDGVHNWMKETIFNGWHTVAPHPDVCEIDTHGSYLSLMTVRQIEQLYPPKEA
jgi:hypothetical protein